MIRLPYSIYSDTLIWNYSASVSAARGYESSARDLLQRESDEIMKKRVKSGRGSGGEDLRMEYRFDYRRAKPNRFASRFETGSVAVVLDPDVASVFHTSESVNVLLRSVLAAIPPAAKQGRTGHKRTGSNINALERTSADGNRAALMPGFLDRDARRESPCRQTSRC